MRWKQPRLLLHDLNRADAPLDWAAHGPTSAPHLRSPAVREGGTARLEEAVAAFWAALKGQSCDRVPLDWARTQNNQRNALVIIHSRWPRRQRLRRLT